MRRTLTTLLFAIGLAVGGFVSAADLSRPDQKQFGVQEPAQRTSVEQRTVDRSTTKNATECRPDCAYERQAEKNTLHY